MTTFKVGDKVRRVKQYQSSSGWPFGDEVCIITKIDYDQLRFDDNIMLWCPTYFETTVDPIDQAKATLEAAGYTITPPKPKITGWVNIYVASNSMVYSQYFNSKEDADNKEMIVSNRIACIHFTEGDGL